MKNTSKYLIYYLSLFFWFAVVFLYFLPPVYYIFALDFILTLIIIFKLVKNEEFKVNRGVAQGFLLIFVVFSILIPFYSPVFPPFIFVSLIVFLFLFYISDIKLIYLKTILMILPFVAIPYSLLFKQKEFSFIYKNNSILGFLFLLGIVFFRKDRLMLGIFLFSSLLTFSKSTYLALSLLIIYYAYSELKLKAKKYLFGIAFILLILVALFYKATVSEPFFGGRLNIWKTAIKTGTKNLPLGVGGFNFSFYSDQYKMAKKTDIGKNFEFYREYLKGRKILKVYNIKRVRYEHNLYLKLFAEYGIFGIILAFVLIFLFFKIFENKEDEKKYLAIIMLIFSCIQNFSLSYVFILPFLLTILSPIEKKEFSLKRQEVFFLINVYILLFSFPLFLNEFFIRKGEVELSKKIINFDYRPDYIKFNGDFKILKNNPNLKNLYRLKIEGERSLILNRRLKSVYSILSFSFYNFMRENDKNTLIGKEAYSYAKEWLRLEPSSPIALLHMGKIFVKEGRLEEAEEFVEKALEFEPFYLNALYNLKNIYRFKGKSDKVALLERVIKKIMKEREKYRFLGSAPYEKIILGYY